MRQRIQDPSTRARELRVALSLSQEAFAERAGIDRGEVSKVERGENKVTSARMRDAFARAAGVTPDRLGDYLSGRLSLADLLRADVTHEPKSA